MLLKDKNCIIFAANGEIARAVASEFASAGANLFLSSRNKDRLADFASRLIENGTHVHYDSVDATDPKAVENYLDRIGKNIAHLDAVFNGIGLRPAAAKYGTPALQLDFESFKLPFSTICGSQFITATKAAKLMQAKGGGSILLLSASLAGDSVPMMAGISAAYGAIEAMMRSLAAEFSPFSICINTLRADGMQETQTIRETSALMAKQMPVQPEIESPKDPSAKPDYQQISLEDTARTALFLASDLSHGISNQVINVSGGRLLV